MGNRFLLLVFVICVSAIIGCGKDEGDSDNKYPFPYYKSSNALAKELESANLSCANTECDQNKQDFESIGVVGMIVEGKPSDFNAGVGRCTGFLYGSNDIVALNSHCITDSMWDKRSDCSEYLGIKFPETPGHQAEVRMCEEIIYRSSLEGDNAVFIKQDYAFFKIKPVNRTFLNLSAYPVKNQEDISARKVNPLKDSEIPTLSGYLDYAHCKAQTNSLLNFNYVSEWSETGLAVQKDINGKTCKIERGNSGSPVLNARGEIVGFVQSYATNEYLKLLKKGDSEKDLKNLYKMEFKFVMPSRLPQHFHFTQAICVKNPKDINSENLTCKNNQQNSVTYDHYSDFSNAKNVDEFVSNIKPTLVSSLPQLLTYDLVKSQDDYSYTLNPICLLKENQWEKNKLQIEKSGIVNKSIKNVKTNASRIFIKLMATYYFDDNFYFSKKDLSYTYENGYFEVSIDGEKFKVQRKYKQKYFGEKIEEVSNISWCQ